MTGTFVAGGHFGLGSNGPGPEYGRAAAAADCATLVVPADERALCPSPAQTLALGGIDGLLHSPASPGHTVPVPPGVTRGQLLDRFSLAVVRQQPIRVAWSVIRDSVPALRAHPGRQPAGHPHHALAVPDHLPGLPAPVLAGLLHPARGAEQQRRRPGGGPAGRHHPARTTSSAAVSRPARCTRSSSAWACSARSSRRQELAGACALVTLAAVILLVSSDAFEFSWRYQLPATVMLPLAGVLGLTALAARITAARTASGGTGRRTPPASAESGPRAPAGRSA